MNRSINISLDGDDEKHQQEHNSINYVFFSEIKLFIKILNAYY